MSTTAQERGALSQQALQNQMSPSPDYRIAEASPAHRHAAAVQRLWGGALRPMMADVQAGGRHAGAALSCPATACTGMLLLPAGAESQPWRNPDAIENLVSLDGKIEVRCGPQLDQVIELGRFDLLSIPANVRHALRNLSGGAARVMSVLSIAPGGSFDATFAKALAADADPAAVKALGLRFDDEAGAVVTLDTLQGRTTRFEKLVPYKKELKNSAGIPAQATEMLSANSVFPLIVPEGHIGRSRTAPMYGNQGLYISIAECVAGDDGPPPHAHSDTQESFFVLDGAWDIMSGFNNERIVPALPGDLVAMPPKVMRAFRNTSPNPARLLVIIQGPDKMHDTVSFPNRVGAEVERRFGKETIEAYEKIRMTFDAEQRLSA